VFEEEDEQDKLEYCLAMTGECLKKVKVKKGGEILVKFAKDYYNDAVYYKEIDRETALEAVAYAHGFIDAGILLGLLDIRDYHLKVKK
jgi:hypothetical protein